MDQENDIIKENTRLYIARLKFKLQEELRSIVHIKALSKYILIANIEHLLCIGNYEKSLKEKHQRLYNGGVKNKFYDISKMLKYDLIDLNVELKYVAIQNELSRI